MCLCPREVSRQSLAVYEHHFRPICSFRSWRNSTDLCASPPLPLSDIFLLSSHLHLIALFSVWKLSQVGSPYYWCSYPRAYCTAPNPLQGSANSFFISKPLFLFLFGLVFDFCLPVSKLTFDIYCLISSLISCFIESRLNWILLKVQADAPLNYFCFLQ